MSEAQPRNNRENPYGAEEDFSPRPVRALFISVTISFMERGQETGFKDKTGRSIHVDDILQHRLGTFGKAGGPVNSRVIVHGGKFQVVAESDYDVERGGSAITQTLCENIVVLHCSHIPT